MIEIRKSHDRGHARLGWLDSRHSFSFAGYMDSRHMGFRSLRVINEDRVQPGQGFAQHAHEDMEILSFVIEGALEHEDSMGNGSIIRPGELQLMRAGRGVLHREFNPSQTEAVHFLQIWILPDERGLDPAYEQRQFFQSERTNALCLMASRDGRDGSIFIHQDVDLLGVVLDPGRSVTHELNGNRSGWVQVIHGRVAMNGLLLETGDGAALAHESEIELFGESNAEVLIFDLA